jgi:hypothetical protein
MSLPLSKAHNPADLDLLTDELQIVDRWFTSASPQHPMRRWEYAMALRAQQTWYDTTTKRPQGPVIDVGGAGSPLWRMVNPEVCSVVDPTEGNDLAEHLRLGAGLASEVYCISVIEHVDNLDQFLYHLSCLVAPGGLLFLTTDYCAGFYDPGKGGVPDVYHYHWLRKRIFNVFAMNQVAHQMRDFTYLNPMAQPWGGFDGTWHGPIESWGYCPASLALVKRP